MVSSSREDGRNYQETTPPLSQSSPNLRDDDEKTQREITATNVKPINPDAAIALNDVNVFPSCRATAAALDGISFTAEKGSLIIVTGPVGSGKTTLLRAILGELPFQSGMISVSSKRISYCSQNPWLLNTSIRENVLGLPDEEVDERWYNTVIHACCLDEDIRQWPHGDQSVVGSKGLTLSGGQRQRVVCYKPLLSPATADAVFFFLFLFNRHWLALYTVVVALFCLMMCSVLWISVRKLLSS